MSHSGSCDVMSVTGCSSEHKAYQQNMESTGSERMSSENNKTQSDTDYIGVSCESSDIETGTIEMIGDKFSGGESVENLGIQPKRLQ